MTKESTERTVTKYKEVMQKPLRPRTVTFLIREDEVLVGLKVRGFGKGNFLGIGGKVEDGKDRASADENFQLVVKKGAQREISEEIGVDVQIEDLLPMGILRFYFPHVDDESWNQEVHVFVARSWNGEPTAKQDAKGQVEIEPKWFKQAEVPLDKMWDDTHYWLPMVLQGEKVEAEFVFDDQLKVVDHNLKRSK